jgi:hypothetical protein
MRVRPNVYSGAKPARDAAIPHLDKCRVNAATAPVTGDQAVLIAAMRPMATLEPIPGESENKHDGAAHGARNKERA